VGAGSVVTKDVPDFALAYGSPAKVHGWVSISGEKLEFNKEGIAKDPTDQTCYQLKDGKVSQI